MDPSAVGVTDKDTSKGDTLGGGAPPKGKGFVITRNVTLEPPMGRNSIWDKQGIDSPHPDSELKKSMTLMGNKTPKGASSKLDGPRKDAANSGKQPSPFSDLITSFHKNKINKSGQEGPNKQATEANGQIHDQVVIPQEMIYAGDVDPNKMRNPIIRLPGRLSDCTPQKSSDISGGDPTPGGKVLTKMTETSPIVIGMRSSPNFPGTGSTNAPPTAVGGGGMDIAGSQNASEDNENYEYFQYSVLPDANSKKGSDPSGSGEGRVTNRVSSHKMAGSEMQVNASTVRSEEDYGFNHFRENISFGSLSPADAKIIKSNVMNLMEGGKEKTFIMLVWNDGSIYQGELQNGLFNGQGTLKHANGYQIVGEFRDGKVQGKAKYTNGPLTYEGNWVNSSPEGQGKEFLHGVYEFEGNFVAGKKHGQGILKSVSRGEYEGNFKENTFYGEGKFTWLDGKKYEGSWYNNKMHGRGKMVWPDGRKYIGKYSQNLKDGFGRFVWADGREYIGYWKVGKQHGKGWYIDLMGNKYDTEWENGVRIDSPGRSQF